MPVGGTLLESKQGCSGWACSEPPLWTRVGFGCPVAGLVGVETNTLPQPRLGPTCSCSEGRLVTREGHQHWVCVETGLPSGREEANRRGSLSCPSPDVCMGLILSRGGSNCSGLGQASRVVGRRKDGSRSVPHLLALVYDVTPGAQHWHGYTSGEGHYPVWVTCG